MKKLMRRLLKYLVEKLGLEKGTLPPNMVKKKNRHPEYLKVAMEEVGVQEISGPRHNNQILEYLLSIRGHVPFKTDETPWCAAFVNWCMHRAGVAVTDSPLARSWMTWGREVNYYSADIDVFEMAKEGDLVVFFKRNSTYQGHVGFYICHNKKRNKILVLGGNQSDGVCYKWYLIKGKNMYVKSYRRLV